jgi:transposase
VRTSIQHHPRRNLLGAVLVSPTGRRLRLAVRSHWRNLRGEEVIAFVEQVLRRVRGPMVLVWDRHPIHRRAKVQTFLAAQARLSVYELPVAAPELNPVEFVWTQVSEATAGLAPRDRSELQANLDAGVARTRHSPKRLRACLLGTGLSWK